MYIKIALTACLLLLLSIFYSVSLNSQISNTKHNLSVNGPGTLKSTSETEVCIFCHTPHAAKPKQPLWNRDDPGTSYTLYASNTLNATMGQPDGSSVMCLSCHDGTIALGKVASRSSNIPFSGTGMIPSANRSNLTSNISDDHPFSFTYNSALATADPQLKNPSPASNIAPAKVDNNSKMQCMSCHDPHKNTYTPFLHASTTASAICVLCHQLTNWTSSTHKTSTRTWNGSTPDPWPHTTQTTVADNACESCHNPHQAAKPYRLMNQTGEEANCLACHNGNVTTKNIQTEFAKSNKHTIATYTGIHEPNETMGATPSVGKHVECEDCHNPHQSNNSSPYSTTSAPAISGRLLGVKGINSSGTAVVNASYEYEVCFKCHAGQSWSPSAKTARVIVQNNTRLEFALNNPAYHAVFGTRNPAVNLLSLSGGKNDGYKTWQNNSVMYCTNCHNNNSVTSGVSNPNGPHGSTYATILKYNYVTADYTSESAANYALCYSCHNRTSILSETGSFKYHSKHIVSERTPCNVCHDPHGISSTQGNSTNNSNLINFQTGIVTPSGGILRFDDLGDRRGRCYLICHGENHDPYNYAP
jgi:predicted CXXCH cytochrome family protein